MTCAAPFLPRAILFDLDDTILSAYSRPEAAWLAVANELAAAISPLTPARAAAQIAAYAREFWSDPDRHRTWRLQLRQSRREIVRGTLARLAQQGQAAFAADV